MRHLRRNNFNLDLLAAAFPIALIILIFATAINLPYWDEWEWADLIYKMHVGTLHFADLWAQHNEHRMLFPELLMLGLDRIGPWSPVREQLLSMFFLIVEQVILALTLYRTARHGKASSTAIVLTGVLLYGLWQAENFTWGFQMAWFICNCSAVAVAALLSLPNRGALHIITAMGIAIIASFTSSQGLIVWAVGFAAIVLVPRRLASTLIAWVVVALATYATYRHDLLPLEFGHLDIFRNPLAATQYILAYLGSPVLGWRGIHSSELAGLVGITFEGAAFISDINRRGRVSALARRSPWYALSVFPIVCSVATASGRAGLGLDQALASRYTSVSGLFWIALIGIATTLLSRRKATQYQWPNYLAVTSVAVVVMLLVQSNVTGWAQWSRTDKVWSSAQAGLIVNDPAALGKLYPVDARIEVLIEELRGVHDGPFRNG